MKGKKKKRRQTECVERGLESRRRRREREVETRKGGRERWREGE